MYKFQGIYTTGFVMGPALNVMFLKIDFRIGQLHVNKYNFIGIFLGIMLAIYNIFVYFGLHDLSRIQERTPSDENSGPNISQESSNVPLGKILRNFGIMLMILSSSMINYVAVITELILPILSEKQFHWTIERLSITTTICVAIFVVFSLVLRNRLITGHRRMYFLYLACLLVLLCNLMLLMLPELTQLNTISMQTFIFTLIILMNSFAGFISIAIAKTIYLTLIPPISASFYEGIRGTIYRVFGLLAYFSASFVASYLVLVIPILGIIVGVVSVVLWLQRKYFLITLREHFAS